MAAVERVLIAGGGIAGLTLGISLRRYGIGVEVVEINPDFDRPAGVGMTLVGNALRALGQIGVAAECIEAGMPADGIILRGPDGSLISDAPGYPTGGPDYPFGAGISRSVFHSILVRTAKEAGVAIHVGFSIAGFNETGRQTEVTFTDSRRERYDLVVGADGIYSSLRGVLFPDIRPQPCGQSVWRARIERPGHIVKSELHIGGRHGVVGICPISAATAYMYIIESTPDGPRRDPDGLHILMRELLQGYGGDIPALASTLNDPAEISYRPIETVLVPAPWYRGRAVLIGDAVHAGPPVLAQGAAMGIEDAVVLAEELGGKVELVDALAAFMERRFERASTILKNSLQLAEWEVNPVPGADPMALMRESEKLVAEPI